MVEIFIENIIASATISEDLDLQNIINILPNCEYNPNQFSGVIYRPEKPPVVVLLFDTGKIMVTAAKSVDDVENSIKMVEKQLKDAGVLKPVKPKKEKEKEKEEVEEEPEEEAKEDEEKKEKKEKGEEKAEGKEGKEEKKEEKEDEKAKGEGEKKEKDKKAKK